MGLFEQTANGIPLVVHASLDGGETWQRIEIPDPNVDNPTSAQIEYALTEAFAKLE